VQIGYSTHEKLAHDLDDLLLRFQVKRLHKLADSFTIAPPQLAQRFELLHALEGDVLALVARQLPDVDVAKALERRAASGLNR
jgi:hypothetical protein